MKKRTITIILILVIMLILLVPFASAGSYIGGWLKSKFGISNPTHQCEVTINYDDADCLEDVRGISKHMCQLYTGYDAKKSPAEQCQRCVKRSGLESEYGAECLAVTIERSHFAGEDLIQQMIDARLDELDEKVESMDVMDFTTFNVQSYKIGVLIGYDGMPLYTNDGKNYFDSLYTAVEYKPSKGVFDWFGAIFKRKAGLEKSIAFQVYDEYEGKSMQDIQDAYDAYSLLISTPTGAGFAAKAVVESLKQGKKEVFAKAAKAYIEDRLTNDAANMRQLYVDGQLAWIERLSIARDFSTDMYLAMLEETYARTRLAQTLGHNKLN